MSVLILARCFLSHLCGGEFLLISKVYIRCFLSHLCGGE
ncbi:hypothetical protein [uncultured Gammaproteobacteria bacterium]|nr:hypothetical protein [uncultured Gammaproteobacteria bacterium]VVH59459.1 hypothetical protein BAZOLSSOX_325 [uncultured Gammaproteobacteria bacterium]